MIHEAVNVTLDQFKNMIEKADKFMHGRLSCRIYGSGLVEVYEDGHVVEKLAIKECLAKLVEIANPQEMEEETVQITIRASLKDKVLKMVEILKEQEC